MLINILLKYMMPGASQLAQTSILSADSDDLIISLET